MNLKKLFRFYNRTLFNGVLIEPKIKYFKSKHYLGWFEAYQEGDYIFADIRLTRDCEKHSTLIHEMVHLYQFQFNHSVDHKKSFKAWRRRIKKQMGVDIK
jgi:hypothetical protein